MNPSEDTKGILALSLVKGMGPVAFKRLLETLGSVSNILSASHGEFSKAGRIGVRYLDLKDASIFEKADREIERARKAGVRIMSCRDEDYPSALREIYDPPVVLYVWGHLPSDEQVKVAVVGSRMASFYGQKMARMIARDLAAAGAAVVSGLALGIDTAAHEGALSAGGVTLAVLGGGINKLYPSENRKMADTIVRKGAILSEYPLEMDPRPGYFPVRNRIISGLSCAVCVVEARQKSGALITADAALEQGKDVFAVPGNADSSRSGGTNGLLRQGAKWATCAGDILEELGIKKPVSTPDHSLSGEEKTIFSLLEGEPLHVDQLVESSGIHTRNVISALSVMEIKGLVRQLPGNWYIRISAQEIQT